MPFRSFRAAAAPRVAALALALALALADLFVGHPRPAASQAPGRFEAGPGGEPVRLTGDWEAYRGRFVDPLAFGGSGQPLPDAYSPIYGRAASAAGRGGAAGPVSSPVSAGNKPGPGYFGTWRAKLVGLEPGRRYGLSIGPFADAAIIFVDGKPAASLGRPARAAWSERDSILGAVVPISGADVEIAVHSSGWQGGAGRALKSPVLGDYSLIARAGARAEALEAMVSGALLAMAFTGFAGSARRGWLRAAAACLAASAAFAPGGAASALAPGMGWVPAGTLSITALACLPACLVLASGLVSDRRGASGLAVPPDWLDAANLAAVAASAALPVIVPSAFGPLTKLASVVLAAGLGSMGGRMPKPQASASTEGPAPVTDPSPASATKPDVQAFVQVGIVGASGASAANAMEALAELAARCGGVARPSGADKVIASFGGGPAAALPFAEAAVKLLAADDGISGSGTRGAKPFAAIQAEAGGGAADVSDRAPSPIELAELGRLAEAARGYGLSIAAGGEAVEALGGRPGFESRLLGSARVPGRASPLSVYDVYGADDERSRRGKAESAGAFSAGLSAFRSRRFAEAEALFAEALRAFPGDGPARRYLAEARRRLTSP